MSLRKQELLKIVSSINNLLGGEVVFSEGGENSFDYDNNKIYVD